MPLQSLRGLTEWKPKKATALDKALLKPRAPRMAVADQEFEDLKDRIGEANARICMKWLKKGLQATSPEILVYDWLTRRKVSFDFQSGLFGGRRIRGGLVTDFVVWLGSDPMAWRVQGEHWHFGSEAREKDKADKFRLLASTWYSRKFIAVCDLWENDLYRNHNRVCEDAMQGRSSRES